MNVIRYLTNQAFLPILCLLFGCSENPAIKTPARLGVNAWVGYDPFVLAKESGDLSAQGWHLVETMSCVDSQRGLRNGTLDAAAMTLDEALTLAEEPVPVSVILTLSISKGADAIVALLPWQDVSGKAEILKVAQERSSVAGLLLNGFLNAKGLDSDILELSYVSAEEHFKAFNSGKYDMLITYEPFVSRLKKTGGVIIFDSADLETDVIDVLVVRNEFLQSNSAACEALILAWYTALNRLTSQQDDILSWLSRGAGLSTEEYRKALTDLEFINVQDSMSWIGGDHPKLLESIQNLRGDLQNKENENSTSNMSNLVALGPIRKALNHLE